MTREELAQRIADASLLRGTFTLRSGRTSSYYLDKYRFSTRPEVLRELARLFAQRIEAWGKDAGPAQRLAGAELGGIPLVTAAAMQTGLPCIFVRNKKKGLRHGQADRGRTQQGRQAHLPRGRRHHRRTGPRGRAVPARGRRERARRDRDHRPARGRAREHGEGRSSLRGAVHQARSWCHGLSPTGRNQSQRRRRSVISPSPAHAINPGVGSGITRNSSP